MIICLLIPLAVPVAFFVINRMRLRRAVMACPECHGDGQSEPCETCDGDGEINRGHNDVPVRRASGCNEFLRQMIQAGVKRSWRLE